MLSILCHSMRMQMKKYKIPFRRASSGNFFLSMLCLAQRASTRASASAVASLSLYSERGQWYTYRFVISSSQRLKHVRNENIYIYSSAKALGTSTVANLVSRVHANGCGAQRRKRKKKNNWIIIWFSLGKCFSSYIYLFVRYRIVACQLSHSYCACAHQNVI